MNKNIFVFSLCLLLLWGITGCGKGTEKTVDAGRPEISGWAKEVGLYEDETPEQLYEKAKKEGNVVIYSISARMKKVKESFEKQYPGVTLEVYTLRTNEVLEKITREYDSGVRTADVIHIKDQDHSLYLDYVQKGKFHNYKPADIIKHIDPKYCRYAMPFYMELTEWFYNDEAYPDGPPISSWWDLTKPEWKGKVLFTNPLDNHSYMCVYAGIVLDADAFADDYKRVFGEDITLHGTQNAGYEFLKRLMENDPVYSGSSSEMVESVGTRGQQRPPVAYAASSKMRERKEKGYALQVVSQITPNTGLSALNTLYIVNEAPHPAGAKLLIRWLMGETDGKGAGFKPFNTIGGWPLRDDITPVDPIPLSEVNIPDIDRTDIYYKLQEVSDFWLSIQQK
ncbi:ABC transporter substrate-binding protein [Treponema sp. HNW]|uniref:ABC transporter substrate-binding protein n=1 Tax=Treponema sp. HNW TaxID=3116654 RepID=UPI003D0F9441